MKTTMGVKSHEDSREPGCGILSMAKDADFNSAFVTLFVKHLPLRF